MKRMRMILAVCALALVVVAQGCDNNCGKQSTRTSCSASEEIEVEPMDLLYRCGMGISIIPSTLTDIVSLPDSYLFFLEMPGVQSVQLEVDEASRVLSMKGVVVEELFRQLVRADRGAPIKVFARKFVLGLDVDMHHITHELNDGLLKVTVPILHDQGANTEVDTTEHIPLPSIRMGDHCPVECLDEVIKPLPLSRIPAPCPVNESVTVTPLTDIHGLSDSYLFLLEMPRVKSVQIQVEEDLVISIRGVTEDRELELGKVLRQERGGPRKIFAAKFILMEDVSRHNITHELRDGLLRVSIPKRPVPIQEPLKRSRGVLYRAVEMLRRFI